MSVAMSTSVTGADFGSVAANTREILKDNGFGVLTEIDMQAAQVVDNPELAPIADEVTAIMRTVVDTLADALRAA